ncbi:jg7722 [Pararge aegeria aegeria]|uniref:Jg7722 protein n=1 Tax=Pararge aegeria aegeria TaxID=348720 RepID=A0A8S4RB76_9NEOP|nr:jg7722 [Pararge aegeria aegeria]
MHKTAERKTANYLQLLHYSLDKLKLKFIFEYQLDALDSVDRRARRLIGNVLVVSRLQSLEHRRKVACLAVFYKKNFGECAQELFDLVKPSPFYHRTARYRNDHRYVVEIPSKRTKRFASSFLIRTAKAWNALTSSVFLQIKSE